MPIVYRPRTQQPSTFSEGAYRSVYLFYPGMPERLTISGYTSVRDSRGGGLRSDGAGFAYSAPGAAPANFVFGKPWTVVFYLTVPGGWDAFGAIWGFSVNQYGPGSRFLQTSYAVTFDNGSVNFSSLAGITTGDNCFALSYDGVNTLRWFKNGQVTNTLTNFTSMPACGNATILGYNYDSGNTPAPAGTVMYFAGVFAQQIPDQILLRATRSADMYSLLFAPQRSYLPIAGAAPIDPVLSNLVATSITSTGAIPQVDYVA